MRAFLYSRWLFHFTLTYWTSLQLILRFHLRYRQSIVLDYFLEPPKPPSVLLILVHSTLPPWWWLSYCFAFFLHWRGYVNHRLFLITLINLPQSTRLLYFFQGVHYNVPPLFDLLQLIFVVRAHRYHLIQLSFLSITNFGGHITFLFVGTMIIEDEIYLWL